jgi:hypothetical protein
MVRWRSHLAPPPAGGDPRDVIRWVRRMEIVVGVCLIAAAALLDVAWARWVLVGALGGVWFYKRWAKT